MDYLILAAAVLVSSIIAFLLGWFIHSKLDQNKITSAKEQASVILADAEKETRGGY